MATRVQKGVGVVAGVPGSFDVLVYVTQQDLDAMQHWEEIAGKDVNGFTQWLNAMDERAEMEIKVEFTGATNEDAAAPISTNSGVVSTLGQPLMTPFESVTLSSFKFTALNGVWQLMTGSKFDISNVGIGKAQYKLRRWADPTQNTLLNETPS